MFNQFGQWFPDFPGQQPYQDPAYLRNLTQAQQGLQTGQQTVQPEQTHLAKGEYFIVPSEDVARNYYVATGNSVTFICPPSQQFFIKKAGKSPIESPKFECYRLVREEDPPAQPVAAPASDLTAYATKADIDAIRNDMTLLKAQMNLQHRPPHRPRLSTRRTQTLP